MKRESHREIVDRSGAPSLAADALDSSYYIIMLPCRSVGIFQAIHVSLHFRSNSNFSVLSFSS